MPKGKILGLLIYFIFIDYFTDSHNNLKNRTPFHGIRSNDMLAQKFLIIWMISNPEAKYATGSVNPKGTIETADSD
ncbi:MAG: hypothetical protein RDU59_01330 [Thermodesulfobacteriota bacterium]|nr:hypothetical protein [Thermodesulfobacteriota bacterium]